MIPLRSGLTVTAHPRSPERSFPIAGITSARNTVRLRTGMTFTVSEISKNWVLLKSNPTGDVIIRVASQAFQNDDDSPTVLTSETAGLGLVTSGLLRIGMKATLTDFQSTQGERVIALRLDLTATESNEAAIVFENIADGNITLRQDGRPDKVLGKVVRAVVGTGRIDGTESVGVGNLAKVSSDLLVISTSPDNTPPAGRFSERRGGIGITTRTDPQPFYLQIRPELNSAQLMGFGFGGRSHMADVQRENGDWERFPSVVGHRADTFIKSHPKGPISALRIRQTAKFPISQSVQAVAIQFDKTLMADASRRKIPVISGIHTLRISPTDPDRVASIKIRISELLFVMNVKPFFKTWDTTALEDGIHTVLVELLDDSGALITTTRQEIFIRNHNLAVELAACQW